MELEDSRYLLSKAGGDENGIAEVQDSRRRLALPIFLIFLLISGLIVACYPAGMRCMAIKRYASLCVLGNRHFI